MKIFIGNLHANASEAMLRDLFSNYGEVHSIILILDENGRPSGYGYLEMINQNCARTAIAQLNKINFMNRFLDVYEAER